MIKRIENKAVSFCSKVNKVVGNETRFSVYVIFSVLFGMIAANIFGVRSILPPSGIDSRFAVIWPLFAVLTWLLFVFLSCLTFGGIILMFGRFLGVDKKEG